MKAVIISILLLVVVLVGGCASGEGTFRAGYDFASVRQVAVVDIAGDVKGEGARNQIANFFEMELLKRGFAPIERSRVHLLLEEQDFQASEITTTTAAVKAGEILNVPAVLLVNIPEFGEEINITAKMINVEDGSILWVSSGSGRTGKLLGTVIGATAGAVGGAILGQGGNETAGGVIGGVLGGTAAYTLSPQEAERTREVIKEMCNSLPQI